MTHDARNPALLLTLAFSASLVACDRQPSGTPTSPPSAVPASSSAASPASAPVASAVVPVIPPSTQDASASTAVDFNSDPIGAPPPAFEPVVGEWYVAEAGGQRGLRVDGSKWREGVPAANLADQAKRLYGDKYAEFLDGVKAFAFFPLAIYKTPPSSADFKIAVRFYPEGGRIDQGAGIAFDIGADGSYQGVRANALEDNLLYFKVVRGKRTVLENIRNTPTPTHAWHALSVDIKGKHLVVELDGQRRLERDLPAPPAAGARVGLWSKADSQVLMDDFSLSVR
jgi:hypothetical protein